ncbi:hypothetical protein DPMN_194714 [Dreissena polymorpha]|uniref:Uncharacterized protein n=1 Tax=Dreissena polymorpha TaxID=45954 RepID=A0A9D3XZ95_DREPO|nr:hypothetical protein DPMN_194714 [Dreissena polymorpha]
MVSKQRADVGLCLDDESHPLYLTPSELDQTCQNVHSLLKMTDEEAGNQFQSREDEEAVDFLTQLVQNNSNDSSGSTSKRIRINAKLLPIITAKLPKNLKVREIQNRTRFQLETSRLTL